MTGSAKEKDTRKAGEILEEAGKLPIEYQERILAAIRGMLFTRHLLESGQDERCKEPESEHEGL
ncbi:hypothetical protein [Lachnotalea sp. AF33-28]|jgi:hypothetical protein|uniref:hypothetical protein n=1 Tax=Lachnotalea sp. AF33-28 TaxID=2292046 RepID=UPI000E4A9E73|nr:hypothetical protein [Lachnotalea sp. AF33-28]RHP32686.1 hypothetical protein DWZ56_12160 [Lachnotalea sp. AF33-28]